MSEKFEKVDFNPFCGYVPMNEVRDVDLNGVFQWDMDQKRGAMATPLRKSLRYTSRYGSLTHLDTSKGIVKAIKYLQATKIGTSEWLRGIAEDLEQDEREGNSLI